MTEQERALLPAREGLRWHPLPDGKVALQARPCPFLEADGRCGVYAVRPMNCRRWGCFRSDPDAPLAGAVVQHGDAVLPVTFWRDRNVRRQVVQMQRVAQRWGRQHGWSDDGR